MAEKGTILKVGDIVRPSKAYISCLVNLYGYPLNAPWRIVEMADGEYYGNCFRIAELNGKNPLRSKKKDNLIHESYLELDPFMNACAEANDDV